MSKPILRIKRSKEAKQFPLLHIAKDGDVGLDIPACLPINHDRFQHELDDLKLSLIKGKITLDNYYAMAYEKIVINPGCRATIPTGIFLEIPKGYWASIEARSSTSKSMIEVPKGVIDEGYRGELFAVLLNVGHEPITIHHGDRWVQLIMHERVIGKMDIEEVDELSPSQRGNSGFGSTGRGAD